MSTKQNPDVSASVNSLVEKYSLDEVVLSLCGRAPSFTAVAVNNETAAAAEHKRADAAQKACDASIARIKAIEVALAVPMRATQDALREVQKQAKECLLHSDGASGRALLQALTSFRTKGLDWYLLGRGLHSSLSCKLPWSDYAGWVAEKYGETLPTE